ncbi:hypothetical protein ABRY23_10440 [Melioribacteraceae bacterium 4301-Me]|uniref:hypothetical protein n=1 Tax=Pyranulibacter aquaticus TaxID=3163344 RepID=UPI0035958E34
MKKSEEILKSVVKECQKHAKRMNYAYQIILYHTPFTGELLSKLSDEELAFIDQVTYRFSKFQDTIGKNFLRRF